jgi:hypothetical protein
VASYHRPFAATGSRCAGNGTFRCAGNRPFPCSVWQVWNTLSEPAVANKFGN